MVYLFFLHPKEVGIFETIKGLLQTSLVHTKFSYLYLVSILADSSKGTWCKRQDLSDFCKWAP